MVDILFPHERPELLRTRSDGESPFSGAWLRQNAQLARAIIAYLRALNIGGSMADVCARMYRLCNGPVGAERLSYKSSFGELVRELGYTSPTTLVIPEALPTPAVLQRVIARFPVEQPLFCKPADGFQGRGACLLPDRESTARFLQGKRGAFLVQSFEQPEEDWRYVLHMDRANMEGRGGQTWRIAYKKVRPRVTGDGLSSIDDLIRASAEIPHASRRLLLRKLPPGRLASVPGRGQPVALVSTGNITQGAYGVLPNALELECMDAFMLRFHADLEARLGARLATSCVDIGIKHTAALRAPVDWRRLCSAIVFFEYQFPFGVKGYRVSMPAPQPMGLGRTWLPRSSWRWLWRHQTVIRFFGSVTSSGRARTS